MKRNQESRFGINPSVNISRSRFERNSSVKMTGNVSDVIPFYCDEVLPGDTFNVTTSKIVRLQTLMAPIMDNLYLDTYWFFVPNRLVWIHWKEFQGENNSGAWDEKPEYSIPQIKAPSEGWQKGSIADYLGVPINEPITNGINALPFRGYALIIDQWFRDQNLQQPLQISMTDGSVVGTNGSNYVTDVSRGGMPFRASKYRDYFTSCLPAPQKGDVVSIGLGGIAPIRTLHNQDPISQQVAGLNKYYLDRKTGYQSASQPLHLNYVNNSSGNLAEFGSTCSLALGPKDNVYTPGAYLQHTSNTTGTTQNVYPIITNMVADLANSSAVSVNDLRLAFATQKILEKDARGGTRYFEILKNHFGVISPDATQQRAEYLGGNRVPLNIDQVIQTSATQAGSTPAGDTTAMSLTADVHSDFTKSFTEHGYLFGLCVVRYDHSYQQGLERHWFRKDRFDYYMPCFANIGEQPVYKKQLYYDEGDNKNDEVFGYNEAWSEYRYKPNRIAGEMRSTYGQSLDMWHLGDHYSSRPSLSSTWIMEDSSPLNRCIAVSESQADQMLFDIYVNNITTRAMPMYSIPGLIDHH